MGLINFINKKTTFEQQKRMIKAYSIGCVIGIIISNSIVYFFGNRQFEINKLIFNIIFTIIFDLWLASPFIYAYIKNLKKYTNLIDKIQIKLISGSLQNTYSSSNTGISVKVIYDFKELLKGEVYDVYTCAGRKIIRPDKCYYSLDCHEFINKFDIVDIKEERRRKLKKIQGWF